MFNKTFLVFYWSYVLIFITFIGILRISQHYNSPRLFHFASIVSSVSAIVIPTFLKLQSSAWTDHTQRTSFIAGLSTLLAMKFFELAFCHQWIYVRQMSLKLAVMYIIGFPRMFEVEGKLTVPCGQTARRENIRSIIRGVAQGIVLQTLLYLIPAEWLTVPSSLLPLIARYARYGLFTVLLYMAIDAITGVGFGIYGLVLDLPMKPVFPAFPFTATSLREFWSRRWNRLIQSSLHLLAFVTLPNLLAPFVSLSNTSRGLLAFTISGLIHEYISWFATGIWSGKYMIFFWVHGLLVSLEIALNVPLQSNRLQGSITGWLWTIGVSLVTAPLFFEPILERKNIVDVK